MDSTGRHVHHALMASVGRMVKAHHAVKHKIAEHAEKHESAMHASRKKTEQDAVIAEGVARHNAAIQTPD